MITIYPPPFLYDGPPIPIPPWPFVVLWCVSLLTPLVGWIIATMLAPAGDGPANRRGAGAIGMVPPGMLLTALLIRFLIWWFSDGNVTGGPAGWLTQLHPLPGAAPEWNLAGVLLLLGISYSAAVLPLAFIAALKECRLATDFVVDGAFQEPERGPCVGVSEDRAYGVCAFHAAQCQEGNEDLNRVVVGNCTAELGRPCTCIVLSSSRTDVPEVGHPVELEACRAYAGVFPSVKCVDADWAPQ